METLNLVIDSTLFPPAIEITSQDKTGQKSYSPPDLRGFRSPFTIAQAHLLLEALHTQKPA